MRLTGWGRYPVIDSSPLIYTSESSLASAVRECEGGLIPFGNGRSYGDSALWHRFVPTQRLARMLAFDTETGLLTCEGGVLLSDILDVFLPRGWFLGVAPGTKLITVGGAVACDVHGKNHHVDGCFSETLESFRLMLPDGSVVRCSRTENPELFRATCGGMGLTGIILEASFFLKRVPSQWIARRVLRCGNLEETFETFQTRCHHPYSVAWIDCLQCGRGLGRSVVLLGDFAEGDGRVPRSKRASSVPLDLPGFALSRFSVKVFNALYFGLASSKESTNRVSAESFFFPLDAISSWNRIYGRRGFTQYQFILPLSEGAHGMESILRRIARSGMASFLAVLKLYGPENSNYLSFPLEGYSLALDFGIRPGLFRLLDELDEAVIDHGGRIYLTKDVRASRSMLERGYPRLSEFMKVRDAIDPDRKMRSLQSERLGI